MSKIRLAVLYGGISGEHEVSCRSAASILKNLDAARYEITAIGVTKAGRWYVQPAWNGGAVTVLEDPAQEVWVRPARGLAVGDHPLAIDVVFLINHGIQGEDGRTQGLMECAGLPYTGAGVLASALGMDKAFTKQVWDRHGLPVVPSITVRRGDETVSRKAAYEHAVQALGSPLFVKPSNSGSSVGVTKVSSFEDFGPALDQAFAVDAKVLIETAVNAREIEVAVMGGSKPQAYGPGEIAPTHEFYDYEAKYIDPDGAALLIPAPLSEEQTARFLDLAVQAYRALDTEGFARVDFFLSKETGQIWLNEINTLPGFTTISMFPRMATSSGLTYSQVLDIIIEQGLNQK